MLGDHLFIFLIPFVAITSGLFVTFNPSYFELVLTLDLWLLGYHHVISTYTRIGFDKQSAKEHWILLLPLPIAVFASVFCIYQAGGAILIGSLYLYWQWYHYSRQSEGIAKSYGLRFSGKDFFNAPVNRFIFYLVPLCSFAYMVSSGPSTFLSIPIFTPKLSPEFRNVLLILAISGTLYWFVFGTKALLHRKISLQYYGYMLTHFGIYLISYVAINDIEYSWLTINIWHNAQYIGFVWLYNRKKYSTGVDEQHLIVSYLSQPKRIFIYMGVCLVFSTLIYKAISHTISGVEGLTGLGLLLIIYSAINFHHYIVDSQIWKLRKPQIQKTLIE